MLKLIQPYTRIRIAFVARQLNIEERDVEQLLVSLILDGRIQGHIHQVLPPKAHEWNLAARALRCTNLGGDLPGNASSTLPRASRQEQAQQVGHGRATPKPSPGCCKPLKTPAGGPAAGAGRPRAGHEQVPRNRQVGHAPARAAPNRAQQAAVTRAPWHVDPLSLHLRYRQAQLGMCTPCCALQHRAPRQGSTGCKGLCMARGCRT